MSQAPESVLDLDKQQLLEENDKQSPHSVSQEADQPKNQSQKALESWKEKIPSLVEMLSTTLGLPLPQIQTPDLQYYNILSLNQIALYFIDNQQIDQMQLSLQIKDKMDEYVKNWEDKLNESNQIDIQNQENEQNLQNQMKNEDNELDQKEKENKLVVLDNLKQEIAKTDFFQYLKENAIQKNYGLAKNFKLKDKELKNDGINRNIWEVLDVNLLSQIELDLKEATNVYSDRKKQKDKIGKLSYLIQKIENAKNNDKIQKTLDEIAQAFNKLEEPTGKKGKRTQTVRMQESNNHINVIEKNLEKKLIINSPQKEEEQTQSKASKKKSTKKKVKINEDKNLILEENQINSKNEAQDKKLEPQNNKKSALKSPQKNSKKQAPKDSKQAPIVTNNKKISDFFTINKPSKQKETNMEIEQNSQIKKKTFFKKCGDKQSFLCDQNLNNEKSLEFNTFFDNLVHHQTQFQSQDIKIQFQNFQKEGKQLIQLLSINPYKERKLYIVLKDSKIHYKNVIFDKNSSFINPKNFLKKDPSMNYDASSDEEMNANEINVEGSDDEKESNDGSQDASGFLIVPDGEYLSDFDSQTEEVFESKPKLNQEMLKNMIERKKKVEPYILLQRDGRECVKYFNENCNAQIIGQYQFPIPTTKDPKIFIDIFEENNQELLKAFINRIHGSYETKKDIIANFINDFSDRSLSKSKVEKKFDLIATKMSENQIDTELQKAQDKQLDIGKRFVVSQTVLNAVEMEQEQSKQLLDDKKNEKMLKMEEKRNLQRQQRLEKQNQRKIEKQQQRQEKQQGSKEKVQQKTINQFLKKSELEEELVVNISRSHSQSKELHAIEEKSTSDRVESEKQMESKQQQDKQDNQVNQENQDQIQNEQMVIEQ